MVKNSTPLPKKSQSRFYFLLMYRAIPAMLRIFKAMDGSEKYFWDKEGMSQWYAFRINIYLEKRDYIKVAIFALLTYHLKEKEHDKF